MYIYKSIVVTKFVEYKHMIQYWVEFLYWIYWFYAKGKTLTGFTNLFSPNNYKKKKNNVNVLSHFMTNVWKWMNANFMKHILYIQI